MKTLAAIAFVSLALVVVGAAELHAGKTPNLLGYTVQAQTPTTVTFKNPGDNVLNDCGLSLALQPGTWRLEYRGAFYSSRKPDDTGTIEVFASLTSDPTKITDARFTAGTRVRGPEFALVTTLGASNVVVVSQPTTYRVVIWESSGGNWDSLQCLGSDNGNTPPLMIRAERVR